MEEYTLNMVFVTTTGKKVTFSVSGAKETVTDGQVNKLMDDILAKNIFTTSSGDLKSKDSAAVVSKKVTKVAMI